MTRLSAERYASAFGALRTRNLANRDEDTEKTTKVQMLVAAMLSMFTPLCVALALRTPPARSRAPPLRMAETAETAAQLVWITGAADVRLNSVFEVCITDASKIEILGMEKI